MDATRRQDGRNGRTSARAGLPGGVLGALAAAGLLAGCTSSGGGAVRNVKPAFLGAVTRTSYDGTSDDLLTAGLGKTGLAGAPPAVAVPAWPTVAELRRLAIYNNYRGLVDMSPKGGYGVLYGPNIDVQGHDTLGEGKIAGTEYLAYDDDGSGAVNVTLMVQVPASFSKASPCIVTATSSGSRGVYGAIATAGEWGLKHGCAVAYADKGTGSGVHDLATNTVDTQDGVRTAAGTAGKDSIFTAALSAAELAAFNAARPNRVAVKHAHSGRNPEKDWGHDTLDAVRFAFWVLNEQLADRLGDGSASVQLEPDNTVVIASSVSNGGAAAIAAAEQDTEGLIDGVAVAEPVLELEAVPGLAITRGATTLTAAGRTLYDYFTFANLYQPCASQSTRAAGSWGIAAVLPNPTLAANRCAALRAKGLLTTDTLALQAEEALDKLLAAGWQPESNLLQATHYTLVTAAITMTYSNAYGRFGVADGLCGLSFAGVDAAGAPAPLTAAQLALMFGTGNGVPPSAGIQIINDLDPAGPTVSALSVSPSTGAKDYDVDAAVCQRDLLTGTGAEAGRVRAGIAETLRTGNLHGKPAVIVAGRSDTLIPVNFNARPYFGRNRMVEGAASRLTYVEVTNAQHFDAFIDNPALPGYDANLVPLHSYFLQAMDRVWATLTTRAPLPPSQLVRTTPRGGTAGAAPAITSANVPPISDAPAAADLITYASGTVTIPD